MEIDDSLRSALREHAKTRGGHKRKAKSSLETSVSKSHLGEYLLQQWGYNLISAPEVQRIAAAACADLQSSGGRVNEYLESIAAMGDWGKSPNNMSKQLRTFVEGQMPILPVLDTKIPLHVHKGDDRGDKLLDTSFLEPHTCFAWHYENHRSAFHMRFGAITQEIEEFWNSVRADDPRRLDNPHFSNPLLYSRGIPIALYGDGVPCTTKGTFVAYGWESLLPSCQSRPPLEKIQLIGGYFDKSNVTESPLGTTIDAVHRIICHSIAALEKGTWPDGAWDGSPLTGLALSRAGQRLADGWFCVPWLWKGDYEFKCNHLGMPGHWSSAHPCSHCKADWSEGSMDWRNCRPNAEWRTTCFLTKEQWLSWCATREKPPALFLKPRTEHGLGMHHRCAAHCVLHLLDLGVTKHMLGNVFKRLAYQDMVPGATPKDRIDLVWGLLQEQYRLTGEISR